MRTFFSATIVVMGGAMSSFLVACGPTFSSASKTDEAGGQGGESPGMVHAGSSAGLPIAGRSARPASGGTSSASSGTGGASDAGEPATDGGEGGTSGASDGGTSGEPNAGQSGSFNAGNGGTENASGGSGASNAGGSGAGQGGSAGTSLVAGTSSTGGSAGTGPVTPCATGLRVRMEAPTPQYSFTGVDAAVSPETTLTPGVCVAPEDDLDDNVQVFDCCLLEDAPSSGTTVYWEFTFTGGTTLCTSNPDTTEGCGPLYRYKAWVNGVETSIRTDHLPGCITNGCPWKLALTL
jgi:hypothetical protein